jgi:hypothetical protein
MKCESVAWANIVYLGVNEIKKETKLYKRIIIIWPILFIAAAFTIPACSKKTLAGKPWIEDLDFMVNRLNSVHPNPYVHIKKEQFQKEVKNLKGKIPNLTENEIIVEFLRLITLIQDGHTRLHGNRLTTKWYPIRIEQFSDGFFMTASANKYAQFIGSKVIQINDHPVEEVFDKIKLITPHDNESLKKYFAPMFLTMDSIVSGLHLADNSGNIILLIETADHQRSKLRIESIEYKSNDDLSWYWKEYGVPGEAYKNIMMTNKELPLYQKNYTKPFWFERVKDRNAVYFAFNECSGNDNFERFNKGLWEFIDSSKADYLIIDLRNNFGGTNSILKPLLHEIIKHDRINQEGHLFVIIGCKTFSAAMHCATWIEFHCHPIFVGEPTGAPPNHFADADFSYLPNSKMLLMISKYYWQMSWPWDNRRFIEPKIKVSLSSDDYFNYRDPIIERVIKTIEDYDKKN